MTISVPTFDTEAMRQIADYKPQFYDHPHGGTPCVVVDMAVWNTLMADHLAAADHIDLLEFALKQRAA